MRFLKYFLIAIAIITLGIGAFFIYMQTLKVDKLQCIEAMHPSSVIVVETENLTLGWKEVKESALWESLIEADLLDEYDANMMHFDSLMMENAILRKLFKNRPLAISVQMLNNSDFETVFAIDIGKYGQLSVLPQLAKLFDYELGEHNYDDTKIYSLCYDQPQDIIHLSIKENLLIGSFSSQLLKLSIKELNSGIGFQNDKFIAAQQRNSSGLLNLYINYSQLHLFAGSQYPDLKPILVDLSEVMAYSAMVAHWQEKNIQLNGFTNYHDSIPSIVKALAKAQAGDLEAHTLFPAKTAIMMTLNTGNFRDFYDDLLKEHKASDSIKHEEYIENIERSEKWLDLDFDDVLFSWLDGEFALAKLRPESNARELDALMAIKANDIDLAKEKMALLLQHIKKRTPVRFDQIEYRNHHIHLLQMKGFFKLFFGGLMSNMEKPYFAYIDNYVVFSNSASSLMDMIDDYLVGNTLARTPSFNEFIAQFEPQCNFSMFIQMPKVYQHLYHYSNADARKSLKQNKNLLIKFANIGCQLNSSDAFFETSILAQHDDNTMLYEELEKLQNSAEELYVDEYRELKFKLIPDDTFPWSEGHVDYWVTHPERVQDSLIIHEGEMRDSLLHGLWRSYYTSGRIKAAIPYNDGKVDGMAIFYFDDEAHNIKAEVEFDDDVMVGDYKEYYSNSRKKAELTSDDGLFDGDAFYYYRNGQLKIEGRYKNGLRHGKWKHYTKAGELLSKESWRKGQE
ncbi:DUF3352 domain-containing protein [Carboxylicivirga sp. N1Y90]|uniref:DUF3352 domain-containing protein n=1 Tax=Carboxylicivirga fragile TaxID=3417571 RepID=UPI003D3599BF|nr:DUF3352 domain-containing protein [Marinilabiliaceae bacterium N1Y90]